jgi:hypothetical protein
MEEFMCVRVEQVRYEELIACESRLAILQEYIISRNEHYLDDDVVRLILGIELRDKAVKASEDKDS